MRAQKRQLCSGPGGSLHMEQAAAFSGSHGLGELTFLRMHAAASYTTYEWSSTLT